MKNLCIYRYGILKNGAKDIKAHEWLQIIDWDALIQKKLKAPFKPTLSGPGDTSNFDEYPEEPLRISDINEYADVFSNFTIK